MLSKNRIALWFLFFAILITSGLIVFQRVTGRNEKRDAGMAIVPRNVFLVTVTSLRADRLSSYLYQHSQTPAIDFLAYDGIRFTNAYTTSRDSLGAHLSMLTGFYTFRPELREALAYLRDLTRLSLPEPQESLATRLGGNGYETAALLSDPELRYPSFFLKHFREVATGDAWQPAFFPSYSNASMVQIACDWIARHRNRPQFLLLNFAETAFPYNPPPPYARHYAKHPYDGEIAALDEQIGRFIGYLKEQGIFDRSIIILTSPYGEPLKEESEDTLYRVPLIIVAPGLLPRHREYNSRVSLVDLSPTILSLLQRDSPSADGKTLFRQGTEEETQREFAIAEDDRLRAVKLPSEFFIQTNEYSVKAGEQFHFFSGTGSDQSIARIHELLRKEQLELLADSVPPPDVSPLALMETVRNLAQQGQSVPAWDLMASFSDRFEQTAALHTLLGSLSLPVDPEVSIRHYENAYRISPHPVILIRLAEANLQLSRHEQARDILRRYRSDPQNTMSYYEYSIIGVSLCRLGKLQEALPYLNEALRQNPRFSEARACRDMSAGR